MSEPRHVRVIDTHTGGEPTRVVLDGGPDLGSGPLAERLDHFRREHDDFRSAVVNEPRGSDVLVGALLCEPHDPTCSFGVIFFNNVGYLGMCGHGMIGLVTTLEHIGRLPGNDFRVDTPVGPVSVRQLPDGRVAVRNVPARRSRKAVGVDVPGIGPVVGDIAWGGNWFFLVERHGQRIATDNIEALTDYTWKVRQALERAGITGDDGGAIDHVELFGPPSDPAVADSRNFVLCPGRAYDRSPCGTGTSAKVACLIADGKLQQGQIWRQQSVIGSVFEASAVVADGHVTPIIVGEAFVTAEATLILDERDPLCFGIRT